VLKETELRARPDTGTLGAAFLSGRPGPNVSGYMPARPDPREPVGHTTPSPTTEPARPHVWSPARLKQFVRRLGRSSTDCEDIVQEAYLRLLESTGRGRIEKSQLGYLLVIARNLVADAGRRDTLDRKRALALRLLRTQLSPSAPSTEELVFVDQAQQRLGCALRRLPPRARQAFLLYRFRSMKHQDIARKLGVTTRTVEREIATALAVLKEELFEGDSR
jgi:RNA polymerase sigma factor (sigma-70 family)